MQTILREPRTDKYSILIEDDKCRVGASSMQGWRSTMEDAHTILLSLPNLPPKYQPEHAMLAAVFDGHCGSKVAQTAANSIQSWLTESTAFREGNFVRALAEAYIRGDQELLRTLPQEPSGATGVTVLLVGHTLYCANAGDSRAVLCRGGTPVILSEDHKPSDPAEKERILKAGGFVSTTGRVNGMLSLSRAFGDFIFKRNVDLTDAEQMVTVVPDVREVALSEEDEFVIIACDGIWDVMTREQAIAFVRNEISEHGDVAWACERLMDACLATAPTAVGCDNMTVVIIQFKSNLLRAIV